jgi:hypothetical protein
MGSGTAGTTIDRTYAILYRLSLSNTLYGAILQAFRDRACILVTAGLMYPQNVTTPTMMHSIFTI